MTLKETFNFNLALQKYIQKHSISFLQNRLNISFYAASRMKKDGNIRIPVQSIPTLYSDLTRIDF